MTSLSWLPGRHGGRLGYRCSLLAVLRLGSVLGSEARAPGSPALTASCLEWKGALSGTDSSSVVLEPRRGSGLAVSRLGQSLEREIYGPGSGHRLVTPGGRGVEPERTQPSAPH